MKEQEKLLKTAEEDLDTAEYLLDGEKFNTSISRSYYSIFNAAKALLLEKNSNPKTHSGVSTELGKLFRNLLTPEVTSKYSKIQSWREEADYSTGRDFDEKEAQEALEFAEEFLQKTREIIQ